MQELLPDYFWLEGELYVCRLSPLESIIKYWYEYGCDSHKVTHWGDHSVVADDEKVLWPEDVQVHCSIAGGRDFTGEWSISVGEGVLLLNKIWVLGLAGDQFRFFFPGKDRPLKATWFSGFLELAKCSSGLVGVGGDRLTELIDLSDVLDTFVCNGRNFVSDKILTVHVTCGNICQISYS